MSEHPIIALTVFLLLAYGLFSKLAEKSVLTAPMIFLLIGFIASYFQLESLKNGVHAPWVKIVAELTLILVLFNDASTLDLKALLKDKQLPLRLLFIGLPLTMLLGILIAIPLFPGVNIWLLALMALVLSPTDAALGIAVVTSPLVPLRIRQTINVESGLNDGIALPPILICLAVLSGEASADSGTWYWVIFILKQFIFGPLIGAAVGYIGGRLVEITTQRNWMNDTFQRIAALSIAILAYFLAEKFHGNGFIAAFFAGMLLGTQTLSLRKRIHAFGEAESQAMILFIFLIFGLLIVPLSIPFWDLQAFVYALLSLTVIRMLPVAISLIGTQLGWKTIGFIGWFGPRGIASVLYLLMITIELGKSGNERILSVISLTVLLSVFLHGLTAVPLTKTMAKQLQ